MYVLKMFGLTSINSIQREEINKRSTYRFQNRKLCCVHHQIEPRCRHQILIEEGNLYDESASLSHIRLS